MFVYLGALRLQGLMAPTSFREQRKYSFAEHPVLQGRPKLQRIGEDLREIDTGFLLHRGYCDPATVIEALRQMAEDQQPILYLLGDGTFVGDYVLHEIVSEVEQLDRLGQAVGIEVSVRLKEVPPESAEEQDLHRSSTPSPQPGDRVRSVPSGRSPVVEGNRRKLAGAA